MTKWSEGRVIENKQWTENLHSIRVDAAIDAFDAGQFTRLAMEIDGEEVSRPFSLVNAPAEKTLDFYFIEVPGGVFSTKLAKLKAGDSIQVATKATGLLTLKQLPPAQKLFLLATGTGIGPFLSIIKTSDVWQQFERISLVHAVRFTKELTYQQTIRSIAENHSHQFSYIPIVSREPSDYAIPGRIPAAIMDKQLELRAGAQIDSDCHVMLCGNPDMVQDTMDVLIQRGLKKHSRREPGHISIEKYW
ncbi:ferredoxin--NADP reductase [Methylophaga muralis]|uniref:ferredoxin--NADP(+) reductase n=1 Tax=Methylophaga muralis TaxID=291169 RepID=A0A1E3GSR2_9GAMM|nr:ferredoxin--NADP reductase [Methylophaga muralis]ODN67090.1 Ferredoxin--NADP reductase [Methylophaga muralis]